jgi:release factor glutamine methyltransferase
MTTQAPTLGEILKRTREYLATRLGASAQLDAQLLVSHVTGLPRLQIFMQTERPMADTELEALRPLVRRRFRGEPMAYILGQRGFWQHTFKTDARALIPRPETERIMEACAYWGRTRKADALRIVDVGTGTGALAISLALEFPQSQVVAIDVSDDALALADENRQLLGVTERVHLSRGDLLGALVRKGSRPDVVVSNPPYIGTSERDSLMADVVEHEPSLALFSGDDGLELIRRLIPQASEVLAAGGLFAMEFGWKQGLAVLELARTRFPHAALLRDYAGHDRVLLASHDVDVDGIARALSTGIGARQPEQADALKESGSNTPSTADSSADTVDERLWAEVRESGLPVIDVNDL